MKKADNPDFRKLPVAPNDFEIVYTIQEVKDLCTTGKFGVKDVVECMLSDINLTEDGNVEVVGFTGTLSITAHAVKELCSIMKIPFTFSTSIPLDLLETNIETLKNLKDIPVKLIINNDNKIVNISRKKAYADRYFITLIDWLIENMPYKDLRFSHANISDTGYYIYFRSKNPKHELGVDQWAFTTGQVFVGDIYRINDEVALNTCLFRLGSQSTTGDASVYDSYAHAPKYKITSNKLIELGDEYNGTLMETIIQDLSIGLIPNSLIDMLNYGMNHEISLLRLFKIYPKLRRLLNGSDDMVNELLVVEEDHLEQLHEDYEAIVNSTDSLDVGKRLATTGAERINTLLAYNNIVAFAQPFEPTVFEEFNAIATSILVDTFICRVETPQRLAEGVTLR